MTIKIAQIDDSDRLRPVDKDHAALIAASIEEGRLEQPIVVRPVPGADLPYKLTEGAHRLEAVRMLGWTELKIGEHVIVREQSADEAKLSEIDENLARHELNPLDRALFLAERKRIYLVISQTRGRGGDRKSNKFKAEINSATCGFDFSERFSANASKRLGLSEDTITRALLIADRLDRTAAADLRGSAVETNQTELLQFIELKPAEQRKAAAAIKAGDAKTTVQAKVAIGLAKPTTTDPQARISAALIVAWAKADKTTRATFLAEIGAQIVKKA